MLKICNKCHRPKALVDFPFDTKYSDHRRGICSKCKAAVTKAAKVKRQARERAQVAAERGRL